MDAIYTLPQFYDMFPRARFWRAIFLWRLRPLSLKRWFPILALVVMLLAACAPTGGSAVTPVPTIGLVFAPTATSPAAVATPKNLQWVAPPPMTIDPAKIYLATFKTAKGDITIQLFADKAPITVNNFVFLAREGFYDTTTFHRVLQGFMAQGGDPTGTGSGGPGYQFEDEFHPDLIFSEAGLLAMANSGPGTNGSQFFITFGPTEHLNFAHTIFGKVVEGQDIALSLALRDPSANPTSPGDTLFTITIEESAVSLLPEPTPTPEPKAPVVEESRPLAALDIAARANFYNTAPALVIDPAKIYSATIETTKGTITVELYPADAPQSVNNFYVLANLGYWDNFPIVFVESGLFALTGSPGGQPGSDVGYSLPSEAKRPHAAGALGGWPDATGLRVSGSQFYFMLAADSRFDSSSFTAFGSVVAGLDIATTLTVDDKIVMITVVEK